MTAEHTQTQTIDATRFDQGDKFETPAQVREYFTVEAQRDMFDEDAIDDQDLLDEWAEQVIEHGWHMVKPDDAPEGAMTATTDPTASLYEIGQHAGRRYADEFRALRAQLASQDLKSIATTDLNGGIPRVTIVDDDDPDRPLTIREAIAYLDRELEAEDAIREAIAYLDQEIEGHEARALTKTGSAWTNEIGQSFPAAELTRYECSCGWKGLAWYQDEGRARSHFERHLKQA